MSQPLRISALAHPAKRWPLSPVWAVLWGRHVQKQGCCVCSSVLAGGQITVRQEAQKGWWMWFPPSFSFASRPPACASPLSPRHRGVWTLSVPSLIPCSSHHRSTGCCLRLWFLPKGLGCKLWLLLGGGGRLFPLLLLVLQGSPQPLVWVLISDPFKTVVFFLEKDKSVNNLKNPIKIRSSLLRDKSKSPKHHKFASLYCSYFLLVLWKPLENSVSSIWGAFACKIVHPSGIPKHTF